MVFTQVIFNIYGHDPPSGKVVCTLSVIIIIRSFLILGGQHKGGV